MVCCAAPLFSIINGQGGNIYIKKQAIQRGINEGTVRNVSRTQKTLLTLTTKTEYNMLQSTVWHHKRWKIFLMPKSSMKGVHVTS